MRKTGLLFVFCFTCYNQLTRAQLIISDSLNFSSIGSLLQGFGTNITNTIYNCDSASVAQFSGVSELPNTNGLLLSTGFADSISNSSITFCSGVMSGGVINDPDMNTLAGFLPTYDGCILEFDCVPLGDTLLFNYTFASEEYPEFVGMGFNDAFGIFLTGPGYNNVNIATVPGTNVPVTVNNVNANINSNFYYDNAQGQNCGFDGFSMNLTSTTAVTPNQTYHFKIGVADASDQIFDTGVFLEAFSFRSNISLGNNPEPRENDIALISDYENSRIVFRFKNPTIEKYELEVFDLTGKSIGSQRISLGVFTHELSMADLPIGIYISRVSGIQSGSKSFKFIKN